jgi:hypothetical protein
LINNFIFAGGFENILDQLRTQPKDQKVIAIIEKVKKEIIRRESIKLAIKILRQRMKMEEDKEKIKTLEKARRELFSDLLDIQKIKDLDSFLRKYSEDVVTSVGNIQPWELPSKTGDSYELMRFKRAINRSSMMLEAKDQELQRTPPSVREQFKLIDFRDFGDNWLSDDTLNAYYKILEDEYPHLGHINPSVMELFNITESIEYLEPTILQFISDEKKFIAFPINDSRIHWYLIIFKVETRELMVLNSFGSGRGSMQVARRISDVLKNYYGNIRISDPLRVKIQTDGFSCGVYLLAFTETVVSKIFEESILLFNQMVEGVGRNGMGPYKKYILERLISAHLKKFNRAF